MKDRGVSMEKYNTKYGEIIGMTQPEYYKTGELKECMVSEKCVLKTQGGDLVPRYDYTQERSKYRNALTFYPTGELKSMYLQNQSIITTPMGELRAEMITFYENGSIHRIFPLYGQVTGFWSEEKEMKALRNHEREIHGIIFENPISCYCFYPSGIIKSITFFGKKKQIIKTSVGKIPVRIGISFYENGKIHSIEPENEIPITTPIGTVVAFDNSPIGVHGDNNSLKFTEEGALLSVKTIMTGFELENEKGEITKVYPKRRRSFLDIDKSEMVPVEISFLDKMIEIQDSDGWVCEYDLQKTKVVSVYNPQYRTESSCVSCESCSGC